MLRFQASSMIALKGVPLPKGIGIIGSNSLQGHAALKRIFSTWRLQIPGTTLSRLDCVTQFVVAPAVNSFRRPVGVSLCPVAQGWFAFRNAYTATTLIIARF